MARMIRRRKGQKRGRTEGDKLEEAEKVRCGVSMSMSMRLGVDTRTVEKAVEGNMMDSNIKGLWVRLFSPGFSIYRL